MASGLALSVFAPQIHLVPLLSLTRHLPPAVGSLSKGEARNAAAKLLVLPLGELAR